MRRPFPRPARGGDLTPGVEPATDRDRFEALLAPILGRAYGLALHFTRDGPDAEDLVQEAALLAYRHSHTFEPGTNFRAWFFRILTHAFYARRRTESRRPTTVEMTDAPELFLYARTAGAGLHDRSEDPARTLLGRLGVEQVRRAIGALPEDYRLVCALYLLEDLKYSEIARLLDVPVGTVRSRLHRGRRILQKALWTIAEEEGVVASLTREKRAG